MKVLTFSQQCHVCPSSNQFDPPPLQDCEKFGAERAEKRFQCEVTERLFKVLTIVFAIPFWNMFKTYGGEGDAKIWVWCWSQFFSNFWLLFLQYLLKYLLKYLLQYLLKYVLNKWIGGRGKDLNVILKSVLFLVGFHGSLHIVVV